MESQWGVETLTALAQASGLKKQELTRALCIMRLLLPFCCQGHGAKNGYFLQSHSYLVMNLEIQ